MLHTDPIKKRELTGILLSTRIGEQPTFVMSQSSEELEVQPFELIEVQTREYRRFNTRGTQWKVRLNPTPETSLPDPVTQFVDSVNNLFDHVLENVDNADMVGIKIRNEVNQSDKPIGFSFRRKGQLSPDVIWSVFDKVSQSNARFNATDSLIVTVHSVTIPAGFSGDGIKRKGRPLATMAHLKRSIVEVRAEENCLAHALIIAIAKLHNDPNCTSYRKGFKIRPVVDQLLETTGIDLKNGGGIPELTRFQKHFHEYKIVVYSVSNCDSIMYQGHVESDKRINLLFDEATRHYHVIGNLTGAMAKRYVCEGCNKGCRYGASHTCEKTCSVCMVSPPYKYAGPRIPCELSNRHFRSQTCFDNHKKKTQAKRKSACELHKCCDTCGALITQNTHECNKRFCTTCKENKVAGHLCFMRPLVNVPASSERVLYVFYDFEKTQDTKRSDT